MISITRGTVNSIILTLTEKVRITNPVFLFELVCDQTRQAYYFIAADVSLYPYRYNEFQVSEQTNPNPLSGEVSLPSPGDYHYSVFQQISATNLDPALALHILETGKAEVIGPDVFEKHVYDPEQDINLVYGE
jgi:hypothetical protein